jgi:Sulfotransferase domain
MSETIRICLWSGPRNISTATMRSFENRQDCAVWDEPFYGPYLVKTGLDHPGRETILKSVPLDENDIAARCAGAAPDGAPLFFQKHMCQHILDDIPRDWIAACRHIFLIRDPAEVAASFAATTGAVTADDIGQVRQTWLYENISQRTGRAWPVIEGQDVLENPAAMLRALCRDIDIPFDENMLSWSAGKRETDGVWAPWWYARVEASTGFEKPRPSPHILPEAAMAAVQESRPHYEKLRDRKLKV